MCGKGKPSILLVEDNEINRKVMLAMLKRLGHIPDTVENGLEALETMERQHYDVVIMDIMMPKMDGLTAAMAIRNFWPISDQPYIIAITACAQLYSKKSCINVGMDDYLNKPFSIEELQTAICKSQIILEGSNDKDDS